MGGTCLGSLILPRFRLCPTPSLASVRRDRARHRRSRDSGVAPDAVRGRRLHGVERIRLARIPAPRSRRGRVPSAPDPANGRDASRPGARRNEESLGLGFLYGCEHRRSGIRMPAFRFLFAARVRRDNGDVSCGGDQRGGGRDRSLALAQSDLGKEAQAGRPRNREAALRERAVYLAIALSGLCALRAKPSGRACWDCCSAPRFTRSPSSWRSFSPGLGIGSSIGALLCRSLARPRAGVGLVPVALAGAIAWTAYSLAASLPYWPINPVHLLEHLVQFSARPRPRVLGPVTADAPLGREFPVGARGGRVERQAMAPGCSHGGVYAANTLGAIVGALGASLLLIAWVGSQRAEQVLIAIIGGRRSAASAAQPGTAGAPQLGRARGMSTSRGLLI